MKARYPTPDAFRQALEQRLRSATPDGSEFVRRRQLLVFDRFLARIDAVFGNAAILKGGLVLELRIERARSTKDVDLHLSGAPADTLARLQEAGELNLGDFMRFEVIADAIHPEITSPGMRYDGLRFRATCLLGGRLYGQPFGVDVGFGDPMHGKPDLVQADDLLGFAGVAPPKLRLYPLVTHIAEKLHAYTMPRTRPNSRVKDLPDLALLATVRKLAAKDLLAACSQTFTFRNTHPQPSELPAPPASWEKPYAAMAREDRLQWSTLTEVAVAAKAFLDPVLAGQHSGTWDPATWHWRRN